VVSESDPLDRPATPEEIEMVEAAAEADSATRREKEGKCSPAAEAAAGAEDFDGGAGAADVTGASTEALGHGCHRGEM